MFYDNFSNINDTQLLSSNMKYLFLFSQKTLNFGEFFDRMDPIRRDPSSLRSSGNIIQTKKITLSDGLLYWEIPHHLHSSG